MNDMTKLLNGSVDDVKTGLAALSHDDLLKLKAAETDGKARKGVMEAIDAALSDADALRAGGVVQDIPATTGPDAIDGSALAISSNGGIGIAADLDGSEPASIPAATEFDTSGAPQQVVPGIDLSHPAVDADPRAGTTDYQNRIDFNDPGRSGRDVVEDMLKSGK